MATSFRLSAIITVQHRVSVPYSTHSHAFFSDSYPCFRFQGAKAYSFRQTMNKENEKNYTANVVESACSYVYIGERRDAVPWKR